jgi:flagellar operon protein
LDDLRIRQNTYIKPVTTGTPPAPKTTGQQQEQGSSFSEILAERIRANTGINFTKHAIERVTQRNVDIDSAHMERLNEGVRLASQKGLGETLILIDQTAFIVNAKSNTVITTVSGNDLKGNVFSNIDGAVII